jgi:hypothetical protein
VSLFEHVSEKQIRFWLVPVEHCTYPLYNPVFHFTISSLQQIKIIKLIISTSLEPDTLSEYFMIFLLILLESTQVTISSKFLPINK